MMRAHVSCSQDEWVKVFGEPSLTEDEHESR